MSLIDDGVFQEMSNVFPRVEDSPNTEKGSSMQIGLMVGSENTLSSKSKTMNMEANHTILE